MTSPLSKQQARANPPRGLAQSLSMMGYVPLCTLSQSQTKNVLVVCINNRTARRVVVKCITRRPGYLCAEMTAILRLQQPFSASTTNTTITSTSSSGSNSSTTRKNNDNSINNTGLSRGLSAACPYVIELLEAFEDDRHVYLVLPWLAGGDLFDKIVGGPSGGSLSVDETRMYFRHVVEGLLYLKHHGIAHGDVSPENVMLSGVEEEPRRAVLIDFGSSHVVGAADGRVHNYRYAGKMGYVPPEVVHGPYYHPQQQQQQPDRQSQRDIHPHCPSSPPRCTTSPPPPPPPSLSSPRPPPPPPSSLPSSSPSPTPTPPSSPRALPIPAPPTAADSPTWSSSYHAIDAYAVDVWAVGGCLFGMLTGRQFYLDPADPAFMWLAAGRVAELLAEFGRQYGITVPSEAQDLLCMMMRPEPADRVTLDEILLHPWVAGSGTEERHGGLIQRTAVSMRT